MYFIKFVTDFFGYIKRQFKFKRVSFCKQIIKSKRKNKLNEVKFQFTDIVTC